MTREANSYKAVQITLVLIKEERRTKEKERTKQTEERDRQLIINIKES